RAAAAPSSRRTPRPPRPPPSCGRRTSHSAGRAGESQSGSAVIRRKCSSRAPSGYPARAALWLPARAGWPNHDLHLQIDETIRRLRPIELDRHLDDAQVAQRAGIDTGELVLPHHRTDPSDLTSDPRTENVNLGRITGPDAGQVALVDLGLGHH